MNKMKNIWRNIFLCTGGILIAACIVCTFIYGRMQRGQIVCRKIEVVVQDSMDSMASLMVRQRALAPSSFSALAEM